MSKEFNTSIDQIADLITALRQERDYYKSAYYDIINEIKRIIPMEIPTLTSEVHKLKSFSDIFNALWGDDKTDVEENLFNNALVATGMFTKKEAKEFIRKAMQNGQIYESRAGYYQKA